MEFYLRELKFFTAQKYSSEESALPEAILKQVKEFESQ